jgi:hypothetical protein
MARTFTVALDGAILKRGFWIYVWEIGTPEGEKLLYVGRTGDNSSPNAQSLFNRLAQNLGTLANSSMVRKHLEGRGIDLAQCQFRVVGHGPIFDEVLNKDFEAHKPLRDEIGAIEKQLANDLEAAGYEVMNEVKWKPPLDPELYEPVRAAFATEFPGL